MRRVAVFVNKDQLVTAPVEGAHAGMIFRPDAKVLEFGIHSRASRQDFGHVAPIHAYEMNCSVNTIAGEQARLASSGKSFNELEAEAGERDAR